MHSDLIHIPRYRLPGLSADAYTTKLIHILKTNSSLAVSPP